MTDATRLCEDEILEIKQFTYHGAMLAVGYQLGYTGRGGEKSHTFSIPIQTDQGPVMVNVKLEPGNLPTSIEDAFSRLDKLKAQIQDRVRGPRILVPQSQSGTPL